MLTENIITGPSAALDITRSRLQTRARRWIGKGPRNSTRQYPLAEGQESTLLTGDFASIDNAGKLTKLTAGGRFCGVCSGVGLSPQGFPTGSVRIGKLWERVEGLTFTTERDSPVFVDPQTNRLTLATSGVRVGRIVAIENFSESPMGHIELEPMT